MNLIIRRIKAEELNEALKLVLDTFLKFETPYYGEEGTETFKRDIIENPEFIKNCITGRNRIWGAFYDEKIVGIIGMRGESHISLLFTHSDYHRRGIATKIFNTLLEDVKEENPTITEITLNSSPYGLHFYHKIGFIDTDVQKVTNGIIYTPMVYKIKETE